MPTRRMNSNESSWSDNLPNIRQIANHGGLFFGRPWTKLAEPFGASASFDRKT